MPRLHDITGLRFGDLTAIARIGAKGGRSIWRFRCDCGNVVDGLAQSAKVGELKYCVDCRRRVMQEKRTKHGGCGTRLHAIWAMMRGRCNIPTITGYRNYGGRGIRVCAEWNDFAAFREWALANGYADDLTIDRIDVNGNYEPSNCRWATKSEQAQNKQQTRWVEYEGQTLNLMQLSKLTGVPWCTLRGRLNAGLTPHEAVNHKLRGYLPTRKRVRA